MYQKKFAECRSRVVLSSPENMQKRSESDYELVGHIKSHALYLLGNIAIPKLPCGQFGDSLKFILIVNEIKVAFI